MSLIDLDTRIKSCKLCSLSKNRTLSVPGTGSPKAELMFIGEGPGAEEDVKGQPFVGASGKFFDKLLTKIKLTREDIFITNIVKCRPPGNRAPNQVEREECLDYLISQIRIINPTIICTLGNTALETLTGMRGISRYHGRLITKKNQKFFPLYHPAAALHNPNLIPTLEADIMKLRDFLSINKTSNMNLKVNNIKLDDFIN
jgi:DNA polymerase